MFITTKKHTAIVKELFTRIKLFEQYEEMRKDNQKNNESLIKLLDKVTDKVNDLVGMSGSWVTSSELDIMAGLDESIPRYVPDYFGGKVIKQEATPVTILDSFGKATYGLTARKPEKNKNYILHYDF